MAKAVLLVETADGDVVAVQFSSREAARAWEDRQDGEITVRGAATVVTRAEALKMAKGE